jgi:AcrR family transcriptional regulator
MLSTTRPSGSRPYRMGRRAEQVDQTRQRITEAAVRLHTSVGPAHTSIAAVAAEAGVTRLTVYRHFADLDALFGACMAHWSARNPRPDPTAWRAIPGLDERARRAFGEVYGWYRDHADELHPLYRDASAMPPSALRSREAGNQALADALVAGHAGSVSDSDGRLLRVVARHLVDFWTWHSLVIAQGLDDPEAVGVAVRLLTAMAAGEHGHEDGGPGPASTRRLSHSEGDGLPLTPPAS